MIYFIANWKMNKTAEQAITYINKMNDFINNNKIKTSVLIAPSTIHLPLLQPISSVNLVSQNISSEAYGAYTGEISSSMVSPYVSHVIVGHSERRLCFHETTSILNKKNSLALKHNLIPIFCFGENIQARNEERHLDIIKSQLEDTVLTFALDAVSNFILAYEPIWAIGTGKNANSQQITEVHNYVRSLLMDKLGGGYGSKIPILYGGSSNVHNAKTILSNQNVSGLLVGGASLDIDDFIQIIQISNELS